VELIGRRRELAAVERLLRQGAAGVGGHLVVTGPPGAGKSAFTQASAALARARGIPVHWVAGPSAGRTVGEELLDLAGPPPGDVRPDLDREACGPRLVVVDDLDRAGTDAVESLAFLVPRLGAGPAMVVATAGEPLGMGPELRLGGLAESELAALVPELPADAVHALWLVSGGLPGPALGFAGELIGGDTNDRDAVVRLALTAPSRSGFLELDAGLIRLLEEAASRSLPAEVRARVLARLARQLLGDPSAEARRRALVEEAVALARANGAPGTLAEVLDSGLHALWDPAAARERLTVASEIVELARRAGDPVAERRGLFWRFTALAELADLEAAEAALTAYARAGELAGDAEAVVVVHARQAMLATVRGRFDLAETLTAEVAERGLRIGLADTERLVGSLRGAIAALRGDHAPFVGPLQTQARLRPGHFYEATAARSLVESGREVEAGLELERLLPAVLAGSGPRWIGAVADLAIVASQAGEPAAAEALYGALLPYAGRLVVWGGANTITGPVDDYLGRLAIRLGRAGEAVRHLDAAVALEERIGALPWLARTLAARARAGPDQAGDLARARSIARRLGMDGFASTLGPPDGEWRLTRDGDDWRLEAGTETARLRDLRGLHYLRSLLAAPGQEIAALDLVAGGAGLHVPAGDPVLDDAARRSYRERLAALEERLEAADRAGDAGRAATVEAERAALVAELRRAGGVGGRPRTVPDEAERARVNATRAVWAAVRRVESAAPLAGAHLRASLRTGRFLRYQPAPGGPAHWNV
jgi:tetratricopeptide (TPR) repeat protein